MENRKAEKGEKADNVCKFYGGTIEEDFEVYQYLPISSSEDNKIPYFFRSVSPISWDNDELSLSQRSSPVLLEDPWLLPDSPMLWSASNSPSLYSPRPEELYPGDSAKPNDSVEADHTTKKVIGPRQSKVSRDLTLASIRAAETRPLENDNPTRNHPLYHNVVPKADGLYHCPFEDDPKANCTHKPEKLKCNYDKFVDTHLKPYKCKINTCKDLCFSSTACLLRHEREAHAMHSHIDKPFFCTYEGCERGTPGNGFPRHWNLRDHMKRVHNDPGADRDSSPTYQSTPMSTGRKRKADIWEESSKRNAAPEQELSLVDRYREQHQKLSEIVQKLRDPRSADNSALLRDASKCVEVMAQMSRRINAASSLEKKVEMDIG